MASDGIGCCRKKQKASCEEESQSELELKLLNRLPDQMLLEILIRLPEKCATRYKVVCRHWCSLISSGHFIRMWINLRHQRHSKHSPNQFTVVFEHEVRVTSRHTTLYPVEAVSDHPELSKTYKTENVNLNFVPRLMPKYEGSDYRILYPMNESISVRASCNDLLLCSLYTTFYVVNLVTKQWIALPTTPDPLCKRTHERRCSLVSQRPGILCYHNEDIFDGDGWYRFKVILLPVNTTSYSPDYIQKMTSRGPPRATICSSEHNIQIYCSETRQWTEVRVDWIPLEWNYYRCFSPILAYNRMLHWVIGRSLFALDLFSGDAKLRLSHIIKLPDEFEVDLSLRFGVCVDRLRMSCKVTEQGIGDVINVWDLEDRSRSRGSWTWSLAHKLVLRKFDKQGGYAFELIAFHPYNRDVIFFKKDRKIYLCNMRTGKLTLYRKLKVDEGISIFTTMKVVPPILHQWYPTPLRSPTQGLDTYNY